MFVCVQIRYNIAQLEQWARDQKVHDDKNPVLDSLRPIIQACQLLQVTTPRDSSIFELIGTLRLGVWTTHGNSVGKCESTFLPGALIKKYLGCALIVFT